MCSLGMTTPVSRLRRKGHRRPACVSSCYIAVAVDVSQVRRVFGRGGGGWWFLDVQATVAQLLVDPLPNAGHVLLTEAERLLH